MREKECLRCRTLYSDADTEFTISRRAPDGLSTYCRKCTMERDRDRRKKKTPEQNLAHKSYNLKTTYGITYNEYMAKLQEQDFCCDCCGKKWIEKELNYRWPVDHDHNTGQNRGIVCISCNVRVGYVEDPEKLEEALKYIAKWKEIL